MFINILVSFFTISITRQQSIDYITNTVNIYLKDTQRKFNAVDHFMTWTVLHEPLIKEIEVAQSISDLSESISDFRTRVNDFQYSTGKEYQFFLASNERDYFFNSSSIQIKYPEYLKLKKFFLSKERNLFTYENMNTWQTIKLNNKFYLYHLLEFQDRMFISLIAIDDILLPLHDINLGNNGKLTIQNNEQNFLSNSSKTDLLAEEEPNSFFNSQLVFEGAETSLPFSLHVSIDHFSAFKNIVIVQFSLIFATLIIIFILIMILLYIKNKVIAPIQTFSKNLSDINQNKETVDLESNTIIELEQANAQFKGLVTDIKQLKISIYEQELEKQQIQMDFMKLQIKPHFYLNCLTTIYSMAQMEMYKEIKEMTLSTSKYFRYLFQTNQNYVKLEKELEHVNDYLSIQKLLHVHSFQFDIFTDSDIEKTKIPPLVIQTFIENTIKHSVSLDEQVKISLRVHYVDIDDKKFIKITLADNGPGFPLEILEKIQSNIPLSNRQGNHIGINNVVQRLGLLYGEEFSIDFSNGSNGGAEVELILPYLIYEEMTV